MTQRVVNYTYGTGNSVLPDGSVDVRDGIDNLQSMDVFMNAPEDTYNQRDGEIVRTVAGMNNEFDAQILNMGFTRVGTFAAGATITNPRQTLLWDIADGGDGQEYGWGGAFPKVVPAASTPASTGGISVGAWISRFDPELRIQVRETLRRSYAEAGYNLVDGSFEAGGTLVNVNDVLLQEHTGKVFSGPAGTVAAGTDPTSGGFIDRSSELLLGTVSLSYNGIRAYSGPSAILRCYGRSNIFDNAAGEFYLDASDTTSADNDCTILVGVGGKRWKRKYGALDGVLVDWAGADPTGASPSDAAFEKAVNAGNGIRVNGNYVLNNPTLIKASNGFFIKGSGRTKSTITKTSLSAPNLTRIYGGQPFNYNVPCIFAFVADDESYVRHVLVENVGTVGLEGDATQVHFFAPRATYCAFSGILSTHGKAIWESTLNGFINSFQNVRTALMSKHWVVHNSNAYTLTNVYSNGNTTNGESIAFEFIDTNAAFISCDCDGLNTGWIADGHSNLEIIGSNSEARLRIFNARGDSSINIHGGRHALSVNASQQSQEATPYRAEGNARINVIGAKAHKFIFGATPTNKFLAIATGTSKVSMSNMQLNVGAESAAEVFSINDVLATSSGEVVASVDGNIVMKEVAAAPAELLDYCTKRKIQKVIDFSANATQTVVTISSIGYNQIILADLELLYRATGNNGVNSVGGVADCKLVASTRDQNTASINVTNAALSPNAGTATITFTAVNSGAAVSIIATASSTVVGVCSFLIEVRATLVNANRTSAKVAIT